VRLLLDTHAFLWAAAEPERLSSTSRNAIADPDNEIFISAAVSWEITIKHALGKLTLPLEPAIYVPARVTSLGFRTLPITLEHTLAVGGLPTHHNDPFDRVMIAQAQVENLTFVTNDAVTGRYSVKVLSA
jgi:PIN domain nuclease of toxin-antitoxin system